MKNISYRKATLADMKRYFEWANDVIVRENAVSTEPIQWEGHQKWFAKRVVSSTSFLYVFEHNEQPFGQVRFDIEENSAFIDYSIDTNFRGQGLGTKMLEQGITIFEKEAVNQFQQIIGIVKMTNLPSMKVFERLGFHFKKVNTINQVEYKVFEKTRKR